MRSWFQIRCGRSRNVPFRIVLHGTLLSLSERFQALYMRYIQWCNNGISFASCSFEVEPLLLLLLLLLPLLATTGLYFQTNATF